MAFAHCRFLKVPEYGSNEFIDFASPSLSGSRTMKTADVMIDLPKVLVCDILSTWLNLKEVLYLDSAYCNYDKRPPLLGMFASQELVLCSIISIDGNKFEEFRWFALRNVKISDLGIYFDKINIPEVPYLIDEWRTKFMEISGHSLKNILFRDHKNGLNKELVEIGHFCPNVEVLHICNCRVQGDAVLRAALLGMKRNLRELCLTNSSGFLGNIFEGVHCPNLRKLRCQGEASSQGLTAAARHLPALEFVDFSRCKQLSKSGLKALFNACPLLTTVLLPSCCLLTDSVIRALAEKHPTLTVVDISHCEKLTSAALSALATHCPGLKRLGLEGNACVDDAALVAFATNCPLLEMINIADCQRITDMGVCGHS